MEARQKATGKPGNGQRRLADPASRSALQPSRVNQEGPGDVRSLLLSAEPATRQELTGQLQRAYGNSAVDGLIAARGIPIQRAGSATLAHKPAAHAAAEPPIPSGHRLYDYYVNKDYEAAIGEVANMWSGEGGISWKRQAAVRVFAGANGAGGKDAPPSLAEQLLIAGIESALDKALGKIGDIVEEALKAKKVGELAASIINKAVDKGKDGIKDSVNKSLSGGEGGTDALSTFTDRQIFVLGDMALDQRHQVATQLVREYHNSADAGWLLARSLYDSLADSLDRAYNVQWDECTDQWFLMQTHAGLEVPASQMKGMIDVWLADNLAPTDPLKAKSAAMLGSGSNENTRKRLNRRTLGEIGLPKNIFLEFGKIGSWWEQSSWGLLVHGGRVASSVPAFEAPDPNMPYTGGAQQPKYDNWNFWGKAWLCAKALGVNEIKGNDPRVTDENATRGMRMVWEELSKLSLMAMDTEISGPGASAFAPTD